MNLTASEALSQLASLVDDYLLGWVFASVAVGLLVPSIAVLTVFSTPILAVMIGCISLTLTVEQFRAIRGRAPDTIILIQEYAVHRLWTRSATRSFTRADCRIRYSRCSHAGTRYTSDDGSE